MLFLDPGLNGMCVLSNVGLPALTGNAAYIYATLPSTIHFTLKMEAARPSKTMVSCHITTWCHNLQEHDTQFKMIYGGCSSDGAMTGYMAGIQILVEVLELISSPPDPVWLWGLFSLSSSEYWGLFPHW
jgi:hypothetical protein